MSIVNGGGARRVVKDTVNWGKRGGVKVVLTERVEEGIQNAGSVWHGKAPRPTRSWGESPQAWLDYFVEVI